jgi:hypothetical protein
MEAALRDYARGMDEDSWRMFVAQTRPPSDPASARASIAAKTDQLLSVPRDENGAVGSFAAAAAARGPAWQPPPSSGDAPSSPTPPPAPRRIH